MNGSPIIGLKSGLLALLAGLTVLLAGCATAKINWNERVGNYTHDQAVLELGPPDKEAKLTDGTVVADWLTRRGMRYATPIGPYYGYPAPGYYGPLYPAYVDTYSPNYFIRLVFASDGVLKAWKKYAQ